MALLPPVKVSGFPSLYTIMKRDYSNIIMERVRGFLISQDTRFSVDEERGEIKFLTTGDEDNYVCDILFMSNSFIVYINVPVNVAACDFETIQEVGKLINLANFGLVEGNLELNFLDGSIRYKDYVNCRGIENIIPYDIIHCSIYHSVDMVDKYYRYILQVLSGNVCADEAFRHFQEEIQVNLI